MTIEEVISELEWIYQNGFENDLSIIGTDTILESIRIAIEALEKQIPKKPIAKSYMLMCPTCNKPFSSKHYAHEGYYKHCGQHISDWSEVDSEGGENE